MGGAILTHSPAAFFVVVVRVRLHDSREERPVRHCHRLVRRGGRSGRFRRLRVGGASGLERKLFGFLTKTTRRQHASRMRLVSELLARCTAGVFGKALVITPSLFYMFRYSVSIVVLLALRGRARNAGF